MTVIRRNVLMVVVMLVVAAGCKERVTISPSPSNGTSIQPNNAVSNNFLWRPASQPVTYALNGIFSPQDNPLKWSRILTLDFSIPNKVKVTGDSIVSGGQVFDFDPSALALTNAENSMLPGDLTWLALPKGIETSQAGDVLTTTFPESPDPKHLIIQGKSVYTIETVSSSEIRYKVVHEIKLLQNDGLKNYANFLTKPGATSDQTMKGFASLTNGGPVAECSGVFDKTNGRIDSLECVWQPFPGTGPGDLNALRSSPDRTMISIKVNK